MLDVELEEMPLTDPLDFEDDLYESKEEPEVDAHGGSSDNTSTPRTMINFLKSFIGSGILGLPYAFYSGGVVFSLIGMILLGILSNYCIRLLVACAVDLEPRYGKLSFGGIGGKIFGAKGRLGVELFLIVAQLGFCCAYVIFISTNLQGIFGVMPAWGYVFLLLPGLVLSSWLRSFKWLAILSLIGQITGFFGYFSIMAFALVSTFQNTPPVAAFNPSGTPIFFGMAVFAYEGIGLVIPMRRSMTSPKAYPLVLDGGFIMIILLSISFGVIGYTGYGAGLDPNSIAMNLPQDSWMTPVIQLSLVISIFCSYPVQMFPVTSIAEGLLFTRIPFFASKRGMAKEHIRNLFRTFLVVCTSIVAISIPYFSLFVGLVGAIGCSMIAYIFPCLFHLKLFYHRTPLPLKILHFSILIVGIAAGVISGGLTSWELIKVLFLTTQSF